MLLIKGGNPTGEKERRKNLVILMFRRISDIQVDFVLFGPGDA